MATRRSLVAVPLAAFLITSLSTPAPAEATTPATPGRITSVTATPGPMVGEITFAWVQDGSNTTGFRLETALTTFSKTDPTMSTTGRRSNITTIGRHQRSLTLSASKVSDLGARVASGNALFFRFYAVDAGTSSTTVRAYPYLQAVLPRPKASKATGTSIRVGSFNVRSAKAAGDSPSWLERAPGVAAEIVAHNPGVVAVQELGPGRADGQTGSLDGTPRQTDSLETALQSAGGRKYRLVRTTLYVEPGTATGSQGARILYDTSRYTLLSRCPEETDGRTYSSSCTIKLPLRSSDSESHRRRAAAAEFQDRTTGERFWFVSTHFDERHSTDTTAEKSYNSLRGRQADAIVAKVAKWNPTAVPVIIGGDFNSWQNNRIGNAPHDHLVHNGYYDTSAAVDRIHFRYSTLTDFKTTVTMASQGIGVRLDQILVNGARGSECFDNVMKRVDSARTSDHNLVTVDIVL